MCFALHVDTGSMWVDCWCKTVLVVGASCLYCLSAAKKPVKKQNYFCWEICWTCCSAHFYILVFKGNICPFFSCYYHLFYPLLKYSKDLRKSLWDFLFWISNCCMFRLLADVSYSWTKKRWIFLRKMLCRHLLLMAFINLWTFICKWPLNWNQNSFWRSCMRSVAYLAHRLGFALWTFWCHV